MTVGETMNSQTDCTLLWFTVDTEYTYIFIMIIKG